MNGVRLQFPLWIGFRKLREVAKRIIDTEGRKFRNQSIVTNSIEQSIYLPLHQTHILKFRKAGNQQSERREKRSPVERSL